jgi:hypothetical protein
MDNKTPRTHRTSYTTIASTTASNIAVYGYIATPCPSCAPGRTAELTPQSIQDMPLDVLAWKIRNRVIL